jgi:probable HAF family extracellular repeat protein
MEGGKDMRNKFLVTGMALAFSLAGAGAAKAPSVQYIGFNVPGSQSTSMTGINNSGAIAGNYTDASGVSHCGLLVGHTLTNIDDPNEVGSSTSCTGINNSNQVVGSYGNLGGFSNGFIYTAGTFQDIIVPTATAGTVAVGINDLGQVVGFFADQVGTHGFFYNGSAYQQLDMGGGVLATFGFGINKAGIITIQAFTSGGEFTSALLIGNIYHPLNVPGATSSAIHFINNRNQAVFAWVDSSGNTHGELWSRGVFTQLDFPGSTNTHADGINDSGLILGFYVPSTGTQDQGFKAKVQ